MTETEIVQSLHSASALYTNKILKQHWKQKKYSYMETPRPDYGLMLLLFGRVDFVSEKQTVHASVGDVVFLPKDCYYEAQISDRAEDYLICFDMQGAEISLDAPMLLFKNASFACKDAFRALAEEGYSGNAQGFKAKGLFYLLLSAISEEVQAERSPQATPKSWQGRFATTLSADICPRRQHSWRSWQAWDGGTISPRTACNFGQVRKKGAGACWSCFLFATRRGMRSAPSKAHVRSGARREITV